MHGAYHALTIATPYTCWERNFGLSKSERKNKLKQGNEGRLRIRNMLSVRRKNVLYTRKYRDKSSILLEI